MALTLVIIELNSWILARQIKHLPALQARKTKRIKINYVLRNQLPYWACTHHAAFFYTLSKIKIAENQSTAQEKFGIS